MRVTAAVPRSREPQRPRQSRRGFVPNQTKLTSASAAPRDRRPPIAVIGLEMPWVLSGCRNSSNLTYENIPIKAHYGNGRTGNNSKRPKGKNRKGDLSWDRYARKQL